MNRRFRWTRHGSCSLNWRSSAALLALLGSPAATYATTEIDCDSTADFCTGDPCVTADVLEITASPCTLDFGSATLKIDKKIRVAVDGGTLSLTAANIEVNAKIDAKHIKSSNSNGSQVSLTSTGSITVQRKIDVSARLTPGAIALDAGGNIQLSHQLVARAKGRNTAATGGTVTIDAAGTVTSTKRGKIVTRGKKSFTNAGDVSVSGDAGADLDGRIEARGLTAGTVAVTSSAGNVSFDEELRAYGEFEGGGTVNITAPSGDVSIGGVVKAMGGGVQGGGTVTISGTNVSVNRVNVRGIGTDAGTISITGATVSAERLLARGNNGGTVDVTSTVGPVDINERIDVRGRGFQGGTATVDAATDANIGASLDARGHDIGGTGQYTAGGNMMLGSASANFEAIAPAGGTIEAQAGGNLTAVGDFVVQIGGCIGLSAGGTLDTTLATFDTTPSGSCP